ncbi:GNAT family N-acetyltransferase [Ensifer sp. ENS10]|jgi:predicted N-acetyltransferase YhbS|uniref:GNAT family N-acetyltransferase n=1 Tax=Sinorhizobium/Ensifer group TaxID=227292 RepID=UPI00071091CA|nr:MULTISPECIES: GNAT family N-acetyltransferase [Sinorhizobium/Ensifer group]KRD49954.1 GNAT family acetyltransferase [Ensifer sp. Root278]MBD9509382.1 GNAT family N-acetyltransferase [Ensifer sp. ENS10]MBV7519846.1 GNAT family N-acetyltransferase [Ensifer sp. ENS12]SDA68049.1 Acetyltransferase (GNAT) family protein [Sinorhizobium sp. NFACC03]
MPDMLVRLYALPAEPQSRLGSGISIRRAMAPERRLVVSWIEKTFGAGWAGEAEAAFSSTPTRMHVAVHDEKIVGFACHDVTALGFFGPTGVDEGMRGQGIGEALLLASLTAMREAGYGYAVIGGVGPAKFYERVAGAIEIPDSTPGIYAGMLFPEPVPEGH